MILTGIESANFSIKVPCIQQKRHCITLSYYCDSNKSQAWYRSHNDYSSIEQISSSRKYVGNVL